MPSATTARHEQNVSTVPASSGMIPRLVMERLTQAGLEVDPLLGSLGIPKALVTDRSLTLGAKDQIQLLNVAASALNDDLFGFRLARDADARQKGPFYYLLSTSEKLNVALDHALRYVGVLHESIRLNRGKSPFSIEFEYEGVERYLDRHQMEFWITYTLRMGRIMTGRELIPVQVSFLHQRGQEALEIERYFGCKIDFGMPRDSISFDTQDADLPVVTADPFLNEFLVEYFEKAVEQRMSRSIPLRIRVENTIMPRLPNGTATVGNVASDLGMSARTLSRRLADENLAFSSILDGLRSNLANQYLRNSEMLISEIAWRLGYTEVSSFVHAFQRWTGKSPTQARRQIGVPADHATD
ncbi:AraC family transcriptional regulator [Microvirga mediterraneensis]|uniref:AraC family transcriptional regulator ligand-binding domain-containing protein n=1 Tax=Microvirga mediterraneensis TaxID=2754695 RepID=A0A838BNZ3_9HYPH|nr:AraC family transcriptional regulator [Microvirga mediterraneensis]MBA1157444.1 AraC family transcriptional regulator ligand-binding domain-containing protein [Microvirga mediterraneensis]